MRPITIVPGLTVRTAAEGDALIFALTSRIDPDQVSIAVDRAIAKVPRGIPRAVLDLSKAPPLAERGVGLIFHYQQQARRQGGRLAVVVPRGSSGTELSAVDLRDLADTYETLTDALAAVRGGAS